MIESEFLLIIGGAFAGAIIGFVSSYLLYWLQLRDSKKNKKIELLDSKTTLLLSIKNDLIFNLAKTKQILREGIMPFYNIRPKEEFLNQFFSNFLENKENTLFQSLFSAYFEMNHYKRKLDAAFEYYSTSDTSEKVKMSTVSFLVANDNGVKTVSKNVDEDKPFFVLLKSVFEQSPTVIKELNNAIKEIEKEISDIDNLIP